MVRQKPSSIIQVMVCLMRTVKEAYLLPVDGFSQITEGALSTKSLYSKLGDMNSATLWYSWMLVSAGQNA